MYDKRDNFMISVQFILRKRRRRFHVRLAGVCMCIYEMHEDTWSHVAQMKKLM
jgi:hypothetical protein